MRVNVYAEEMTDRVEVVKKDEFTGIRFYLYMPVTLSTEHGSTMRGPFLHKENDDDSSAITFWGKKDLKIMLEKALALLNELNS